MNNFYLKAGLLNFLDGAIFCLLDPDTGVNVLNLSTWLFTKIPKTMFQIYASNATSTGA